MNHVTISIASASRATRAIWKGREIWAINSNFGIRAARVEPQIVALDGSYRSCRPRNTAWTTVSVGTFSCVRACVSLSVVSPAPAPSWPPPTIAT